MEAWWLISQRRIRFGDGVRVIGKDGKPRDFTDLESKQNAVAWRKAKSVGGVVEK